MQPEDARLAANQFDETRHVPSASPNLKMNA
jgi:hypothetical protein